MLCQAYSRKYLGVARAEGNPYNKAITRRRKKGFAIKIVDTGVLGTSFMDFSIPSDFAKSALHYCPQGMTCACAKQAGPAEQSACPLNPQTPDTAAGLFFDTPKGALQNISLQRALRPLFYFMISVNV